MDSEDTGERRVSLQDQVAKLLHDKLAAPDPLVPRAPWRQPQWQEAAKLVIEAVLDRARTVLTGKSLN